jgi:TolA-binding protein
MTTPTEQIPDTFPLMEANLEQSWEKTQMDLDNSIQDVIHALFMHPSILTRFAEFWAQYPAWQRALGGVLVSGSLFALGAFAHVGILITLSIFSAFSYSGCSFMLEEHYQSMKNAQTAINSVVKPLINSLNQVVAKFRDLNKELENKVNNLSKELKRLEDSCSALNSTQEDLRKDLEVLHVQNQNLEKSNHESASQITKLNKVVTALGEMQTQFTIYVTLDEEKKKAFNERLNEFLTNNEVNYLYISERISKAEMDFAILQSKYDECNQQYQACIASHERLLTAHEKLLQQQQRLNSTRSDAISSSGLSGKSMFAETNAGLSKDSSESKSPLPPGYHESSSGAMAASISL